MTIDDLKNLIQEHTQVVYHLTDDKDLYESRTSINGCELLEHIVDVPGFVELLGKFFRWNGNDTDCIIPNYKHKTLYVSFVDDHPDPIEFILNGDNSIEFHFYFQTISICSYGGGSSFQYTFRVSDDD